MRKRIFPALLVVELLLALAACGPEGADTAATVTPSAVPTISATPTTPPTETPAPSPTLEGDYPPELLEVAQTPIREEIARFGTQPGVKFKGSEITMLEKQHSFVTYETITQLWWLRYRIIPEDMGKVAMNSRSTDGKGGILGDCFLAVNLSPDGITVNQYLGSIPNDGTLDLSDKSACEKKLLEMLYGIANLEFSLNREGFPPLYSGLGGNGVHFMAPDAYENYTEEKLPWDVFVTGDYWRRSTWEGLTAVSLVSPSQNREYLYSIDTTLPNVETYRGISLGATREEVMAAYPEIDPANWSDDEFSDQLIYESIPGYIAGDFLHFYFDSDGKVSRIMMENIVD